MADPTSIDDALACYGAQRFEEAAAICERVLGSHPDHPDALHLLAAMACQQARHDEAAALVERAMAAGAEGAEFFNTLGLARLGQDRVEEAEASFRWSVRQRPEFWQGHNNLATALRRLRRFEEALASHARAIELAPSTARTHANAGRTLNAMDEPARAARCLGLAADLAPGDPLRHAELGDTLQTLGQYRQAIDSYRRALERDDTLVCAWYGLGCALAAMSDHADAVDALERALSLAPDHAPAHHNLGTALLQLGHVDEGLDRFRRAAALDTSRLPRLALAVAIPGSPAADQQTILDVRRDWAARLVQGGEQIGAAPRRADTLGRPLRIGYVSAFFHKSNWMKPVWGLVNHHDRRRFEVHLFSDGPASQLAGGYRPDPSDRVHDTSRLSNHDLARLIEQDGIDILVDLNGYSAPERLPVFVQKPAPIVVGWFNMYATTGLACYDHLVGDTYVIAPEDDAFYTEPLTRIGGSYLAFEVAYAVPDVAPPPCLRNGYITFGSLASQYKITPQVIAAWSAILRGCPDCRLVLKNRALGSPGNQRFVARLFAGSGVEAGRVELDGPSEHVEFLRKYGEIDLALDPFPYNGGTTTTEAIWQGVPVLTFSGDRWASRTSASLLGNCHLSAFVTDSLEAHLEQAIEWGRRADSPPRLAELRATMRDRLRASPVCDTVALARNMEAAFTRMWEG